MPRRKRGRDKSRGETRRDRRQDLPKLNAQAAWRIGDPKPRFRRNHVMVEEPPRQRRGPRTPFPRERELGETIGFYNLNGRTYLGRPDDKRTGVIT